MSTPDACAKISLGFLTVVADPQHGLCGGYLLLDRRGRPLEFHCTVPVRPNRAQEILYGPTLESFLYGEQIGQALVSKSKLAPAAIFTDQAPALAVRDFVSTPVALILEGDEADQSRVLRIDAAHAAPRWHCFSRGSNRLAVPAAHTADQSELDHRLGDLAETLDLAEPFSRIREAISEAQGGRAANQREPPLDSQRSASVGR